jgi:signal peptidase I
MMISPMIRQVLTASAAAMILATASRAWAAERPVSRVAFDAAVVDAMAVAAQRPDLSVVRVSGRSMLPYFGEEAVIVMKKIDAAKLRVGMIAIYVNRFGEQVAHRVIARAADGWRVQGYNNDEPDSTVVNRGNLLGIVYATFHSAGRPPVTVAAGSIPAIPTVYASPAK